MTGIEAGSTGAIAAGRLLGGNVDPGQQAKTTSDAVTGLSQSFVKQGQTAAEAQKELAAWAAQLGSTDPTITATVSAVEAMTSSLIDASRASMSLPQQMQSIAEEMNNPDLQNTPGGSERFTQLQQNLQGLKSQGVAMAQQYLQAQHSLNIQLEQGAEDYNKQVSRSNDQFYLQQRRASENNDLQVQRSKDDFRRQELYAQQDFNTQMLQAQQDYQTSMDHATRDFAHQEAQYIKSVAESMDPWAQVQARSVTDAQQALANISQQNQLFARASQQLNQLKKMGLSQNVVDVLGLSDPKNMEQLNRFFVDVGQNPQLVQSFNDSIKDRLDWTQGLATNESSTQWQEMEYQFRTAADDAEAAFKLTSDRATAAFELNQQRSETSFEQMLARNAADFKKMTQQSQEDFNTQMANMATDYQTSITRSLQSINDFATDAYGSTEDIMKEALDLSTGNLHTYFQTIQDMFNGVTINAPGSPGSSTPVGNAGSASNPVTTAGTLGVNESGTVGTYDASGHFSQYSGTMSQAQQVGLPHIGNPTAVPATGTPAQNQAWAKWFMQKTYGWTGSEYDALVSLWNGESGWRQNAKNPSSGAYGIPQSLPANKMASVGPDWLTNPATQMTWGLQYIKAAYGDPANAWAKWQARSPHWYAAGAIFNGPKQIGVGEAGSEMVLPLNNRGVDFLLATARQLNSDAWQARNSSRYASSVSPTISTTNVDSSTNFNGPVTVQAQDPNEMANALKQKARMQALTRPDMVSGML